MSPTAPPPLAARLPEPLAIASPDGTSIVTYEIAADHIAADGTPDEPEHPAADLLFVHATGFCAGVWMPVASRFGPHRRGALDVRGHGRSAVPEAGMHWSGTAADVLATVDALGLDRPFGIGHSMGGASLVLAEQARPGTFRGLWLYEPIIFPTALADAGGDNPLVAGALRRRADFESAAVAYENFASKAPMSVLDPQALAAYVEYGFEPLPDGTVTLRCRPEVEAATYEMGPVHDAFEHLGELTCPVTVARGGDTGPGPAALVPGVVDALPKGRIEEHPQLGHFGPLQDPSSIAAAVASAIAESERV